VKLGSFGAAARELDPEAERDTFDFFDSEFTVHGIIPPMLVIRLGALMHGEIGSVEGFAVVYKALQYALTIPGDPASKTDPDWSEFDRFEELATDRRCTIEELLKLAFSLVGIQVDFPTGPQPTSPDGLPITSDSSNSSASDTQDSPTSASGALVSAG